RAAATAHATSFFQELPLAGVGEDTWRRMWAAAEAYGQAFAYPDHTQPNTEEGARCVLCQQELNGDAKARMQGFADFIQDRLQAEATAAELRA
ncbi:chromosome segregation protein SMC, partial [Stenotrophomonas indicatrix]|nr:chromosome segregation protein SMC [Stenotrophomonas indicatrix]